MLWIIQLRDVYIMLLILLLLSYTREREVYYDNNNVTCTYDDRRLLRVQRKRAEMDRMMRKTLFGYIMRTYLQ